MSELPITEKEYNFMVLMTDFLTKFKNIAQENENITDLKFIPKNNRGYEINYYHSGEECIVIIKKNVSNGLNIKISRKLYRSDCKEDNDFVISRIL